MKELIWQFFVYGIPFAMMSGLLFGVIFSYIDDRIKDWINKKK